MAAKQLFAGPLPGVPLTTHSENPFYGVADARRRVRKPSEGAASRREYAVAGRLSV